MQLQTAAATWQIKTQNDFAFSQITLVLVYIMRCFREFRFVSWRQSWANCHWRLC